MMMDNAENVNQRIAGQLRRLRSAAGLSLDALAAKTGVSRSMLSLMERAECSPTAVILERLAVGLNVTLATLFESDPESQAPKEPVQRRAWQMVRAGRMLVEKLRATQFCETLATQSFGSVDFR
jgi:transcriptional regulator with XRE-family HTH domain